MEFLHVAAGLKEWAPPVATLGLLIYAGIIGARRGARPETQARDVMLPAPPACAATERLDDVEDRLRRHVSKEAGAAREELRDEVRELRLMILQLRRHK